MALFCSMSMKLPKCCMQKFDEAEEIDVTTDSSEKLPTLLQKSSSESVSQKSCKVPEEAVALESSAEAEKGK